ncbi:hypothetical protein J6590_004649 [Homalodisca vitripennis]|nr:hypothetical protein J6590_004649 [Homalodisca vitripennis]
MGQKDDPCGTPGSGSTAIQIDFMKNLAMVSSSVDSTKRGSIAALILEKMTVQPETSESSGPYRNVCHPEGPAHALTSMLSGPPARRLDSI